MLYSLRWVARQLAKLWTVFGALMLLILPLISPVSGAHKSWNELVCKELDMLDIRKRLVWAVMDSGLRVWVIWCPPNYCGHQSGQYIEGARSRWRI